MTNRIRISILMIILLFSLSAPTSSHALNLYKNHKYKFSIVLPEGWTQEKGIDPDTVVVSNGEDTDNINIIVVDAPGETIPNEKLKFLIDFNYKLLKESYPDARLLDSGITEIDNEKAIWYLASYTFSYKNMSLRVKAYSYQVAHKWHLYTINCSSSADRYMTLKNMCLQSIKTMSFEN